MNRPHISRSNARWQALFATAFWLPFSALLSAGAAELQLAWDANSEPDIAGYRLYRGTIPSVYTWSADVGFRTSTTAPDLSPGQTYYFAVTAYNVAGLESDPSAELRTEIPPEIDDGGNPPLASGLEIIVPEDSLTPISLPGSDPESAPLTFSILTQPSNGILVGSLPNVSYQPNPNFFGPDSFLFAVSDGHQSSLPAEVSITVTPVNDVPLAISRTLSLTEDSQVLIILTATDAENSPLVPSVTRPPEFGTLTGTPPILFYRPFLNFFGTDFLEFTARDDAQVSPPGRITINVLPVNDRPIANPSSLATPSNTPLPIALSASDPESQPLIYAVSQPPLNGSITGTGPLVVYTPRPGFSGVDTFSFTASDGLLTSTPAVISVSVSPALINQPPTSTASSVTASEDSAIAFALQASDPNNDPLTFVITSPPAHGTLSGTPPNLVYQPIPNYFGSDSIDFIASDGSLSSTPTRVSITVLPVNDPPVAFAGTSTIPEDSTLQIVLSGSDTEGSPVTFSIVTGPTRGTLTGTLPNLVYRPATNSFGTDSLTFVANDGTANSAAATYSINVLPINDPPVTINSSFGVPINTPTSFSLRASDPDGDPLTFRVVSGPNFGSVQGTPPNLTYTPNVGHTGQDVVRFNVSDGSLTSAAGFVVFTVSASNRQPVATSVSASTTQGVPLQLGLVASDPDGTPLAWIIVRPPLYGTILGIPPFLTYVPSESFVGTDTFEFSVSDGALTAVPAVASISVTPANQRPTASPNSVTTPEDSPIEITLQATDPDSPTLQYSIARNPSFGSLSGTPPDLFYTPFANFNGSDSFEFAAWDGTSQSFPATVSIQVSPINDPPVPASATFHPSEDSPFTIELLASDPDSPSVSISISRLPVHGTLSGAPPNVTYQPSPNFSGTDSFSFTANDGFATSSPAEVTLHVAPVNDPPTAVSISRSILEDAQLPIALSGSDIDGPALTFSIERQPTFGTLTGAPPNVVYVPRTNFAGSDSFAFTTSDGFLVSPQATVSISVAPVNDTPIANPRSLSLVQNTLLNILLTGTDPDGNRISFAVVSPPTSGTLSGTAPNLTYTPSLNYSGPDSFQFVARDFTTTSAPATVSITVTADSGSPTGDSSSTTSSDPEGDSRITASSELAATTTSDTLSFPKIIRFIPKNDAFELLFLPVPNADSEVQTLQGPLSSGNWTTHARIQTPSSEPQAIRLSPEDGADSLLVRVVSTTPESSRISETWGARRLGAQPQTGIDAIPFLGPVVLNIHPDHIERDSLTFATPQSEGLDFNPQNEFATHALFAWSTAPGSPASGAWWTITSHINNRLTLNTRGEDIESSLMSADSLEIVRLLTVEEVFGSTEGSDSRLREGDQLSFDSGHGAPTVLRISASASSPAAYYVERLGTVQGPLPGNSITFLPAQPYLFESSARPGDLWYTGRAASRAFRQYVHPLTPWISNPFPTDLSVRVTSIGIDTDAQEASDVVLPPASSLRILVPNSQTLFRWDPARPW